MSNMKVVIFPKMLSLVLIFLAILFFIPNFTMFRIVQLGPIRESLAIFFFPFVYPIADAITEVYDANKAMFIIFSCYLISLFFSLVLMLSSFLPFPSEFNEQSTFDLVLNRGPNIIFVGAISVGISMLVNIQLMAKLKLKFRNRHFIFRSFVSSSIGELIVTGLAYPLLFGRIDMTIIMLMLNAYLFKVGYSLIATYPAKGLVFLMRKIDDIPYIDINKEFQAATKIAYEPN